jgi:hypothetical protein
MTAKTKRGLVSLALAALVGLVFPVCPSARGEAAKPTPGPKARTGDEGSPADYVTEKRSDGTTVKYKKKTTYDFEGSSIDGVYNKPSGSYISNIKDVKAKSIIRIRENFDAEVIDSSRLMK